MVDSKVIQEMKRRGYSVTETADKALLVERDVFWGKFSFDTGISKNIGAIKWGRTLLLSLVYGLGLVGGLWWLYSKRNMEKEVLALTQGKS